MEQPVAASDVFDPRAAELQQLRDLGVGSIQPDFSNPQVSRFLVQQLTVRILEIQELRHDLTLSREEGEVLKTTRESLRVKLAKAEISWIEIPAGILTGFAVNTLTTDHGDPLGWVMLGVGLAIVILTRRSQLSDTTSTRRST
jgi:hypothetical protein